MSSQLLKTKYALEKKIDCFFTQQQIQVSKDGKHIYCQCTDKVNIVELNTGNVVRRIECEDDEVTSISIAPNNSTLAIGLNSSTVKNYELTDVSKLNPRLLTSFKTYHRGPVLTMCWDSSSVLLATGSSDGSARIWDLKQKFCTHSLKEGHGIIRVLMFDTNLKSRPWIYGASGDHILIWLLEAGTSKVMSKLQGHDSPVTGFQLSHSREQLISCGLDKVIILWDLNTFASKRIIPVFESLSGVLLKPHNVSFCGVPKESEDNFVFTIGNSGTPRIWNIDKGKEVWKASESILPSCEKEVLLINQMHLLPDQNSIALTTYDNNILFINCDSMEVSKQLVGNNEEVLDVIFLGEGQTHTAVASNNSQIRVYENESNNCHLVRGHAATVLALANHPVDKNVFGSSSHDNSARIWRLLSTGRVQCLALASGHTHSVGDLALARDFLVTGSKDSCIKMWKLDLSSKSSESPITLTSTRTQIAHEKDINSVAVSKNFRLVATGSLDKTAKVWNSSTLELMGTLKGHRKGIWCIRFSPTDCLLATSSADATIKLWTLPSCNNIATFEGHEVSVLRVCWISEGLQLVSAGADGLLKLWTLKNNTCVGTFDEHEGRAWALSVAEGGRKLVTGDVNSTLIWWKDVTEEEKKNEQEEAQRLVEEEQTLLNLLQQKKWPKALRLSLRLNQPFRCLTTMKALLDESPEELPSVIDRLRGDEVETLLQFVVQWNTKTKNVREAQIVVNFLLKHRLPEELEAIPDWQTILEGLLPYTEKHLKRNSALHQSVSIINYMNQCFSLEATKEFEQIVDLKIDEETILLQTIPKNKSVTNGQGEVSDADDDGSSSDGDDDDDDGSSSDGDDDDDDDDEMEVTPERRGPIESVDDIRSNFVIEKIVAETDDDEDDDEEDDNDYYRSTNEASSEEQNQSDEE